MMRNSLLVLALAATAASAQGPAIKWDGLTRAKRDILAAGDERDAAAAYARGCAINRQSKELQDAYLRKTLLLGRPDLALVPARELLKLDPKNALAWGTVAYDQAKNELYSAALPNALKAFDLDPANPSITQNAAQLVAWAEGGKHSVDEQTRKAVEEFKGCREGRSAYNKARQGFGKLDDEKEKKEKQAQEADREAEKLKKQYDQLVDDLNREGKGYENDKKRVYRLERSIAQTEDRMHRANDYSSRRSAERSRSNYIRQIRDARKSMAEHVREAKKIKDKIGDIKREAHNHRLHADRLLREAARAGQGVPENFAWLPPAVNGRVVPDKTLASKRTAASRRTGEKPAVANSYLAPGQTAAKPDQPAPGPSLNDAVSAAEAADKLNLAKICMDSTNAEMKAKAKELLTVVVTKYPETPSAAEARQLLDKLK